MTECWSVCMYGLKIKYDEICYKNINWGSEDERYIWLNKFPDDMFSLLKYSNSANWYRDIPEKYGLYHVGYYIEDTTLDDLINIQPKVVKQLKDFCKLYKLEYTIPKIIHFGNCD